MSNQLNRDHYIYFLVDKNSDVRYVGMGRMERHLRTQGRSEDFMLILKDSGSHFVFQHTGLNKAEAQKIESEYLNKYVDNNQPGWKLINKVKGRTIYSDVIYSELIKFVYLDESSPTGLRWKEDAKTFGFTANGSTVKDNVAGWPATNDNYGGIQILKRTIPIHRVLWVLYNKLDLPWNLVINHIDSTRNNNSKENLEAVSYSTNSRKKKKQHNNTTGHVGVCYCTTRYTYAAHIYLNCVRKDKYFSARKYGQENALNMAIAWRKEMEDIYYQDKYEHHALTDLENKNV